MAPGVERRFGFEKLKQYDITAWQGLKVPALDAKRAARGKRGEALGVYGSDISGDMLEKARANLERAGVPSVWLAQVDARDDAAVRRPGHHRELAVRRADRGARPQRARRGARDGRNRGNDDASAAPTPTHPTASSSTRSAMR